MYSLTTEKRNRAEKKMCFSFLSWLGKLVFIINLQYIRLHLLLLSSLCLSPSRYAILHLLIGRAIYVSSLACEFM